MVVEERSAGAILGYGGQVLDQLLFGVGFKVQLGEAQNGFDSNFLGVSGLIKNEGKVGSATSFWYD